MDDGTAIRFMRALACLARIEGMKAENDLRKLKGESPAYGETAFFAEADTLEELSRF